MKLFLASSLDKTLPFLKNLLSHKEIETKVAFVANAADHYEDQWWVDIDRKKFKELGYQIIEIDLRKISQNEFSNILKDIKILHVCGGSVFYLMNLIREKGLNQIITDAVKNESIVYTGTSAGSIIASHLIKPFSYDEEEKRFISDDTKYSGLGLINFGIVPHCNNVMFIDENKKIIEHLSENIEPLIFIQDNQAIWVENDTFKIVSM